MNSFIMWSVLGYVGIGLSTTRLLSYYHDTPVVIHVDPKAWLLDSRVRNWLLFTYATVEVSVSEDKEIGVDVNSLDTVGHFAVSTSLFGQGRSPWTRVEAVGHYKPKVIRFTAISQRKISVCQGSKSIE